MRESELIEWIRSQSDFDPAAVPVGPGDDMAVLVCGRQRVLVTTDQVLDGVHFVLAEHGPRAVGWKAMARCLSDVAAMAAECVAAVATVALPRGFARADAEELYRGMRAVGEPAGCPLVGGDVGSWPGPLSVSMTALARPGGIEPVLRSGARVGDVVFVTDRLGGAWRTGRHLAFTPRIEAARALATATDLHAMIDLSDGLSTDLAHVCRASGVGAEVIAEAVPIHPDAGRAEDPLAAALGDGEDYELLFTVSPEGAGRLLSCEPGGVPLTRIGRIVQGDQLTLLRANGRREPLRPTGWEHRT